MDLDALDVTQTWLTDNVLDQKIVGQLTPGGYSFHHAARVNKKGGDVSILLSDSLKYETLFALSGFSKLPTDFVSAG